MNEQNLAGNSRIAVDFLGNEWTYDCMGCAVVNGDVKLPGGLIFDGKYAILGPDPEVPIPGFLVINSKRHVKSFSELDQNERHEVSDLIACAEKALREYGITEEVTVVQEERSRHLHVWIFPNYAWMTEKFGKGVQYLRDIMEYAQNNATENTIKETLSVIEKVRTYFETHNLNA